MSLINGLLLSNAHTCSPQCSAVYSVACFSSELCIAFPGLNHCLLLLLLSCFPFFFCLSRNATVQNIFVETNVLISVWLSCCCHSGITQQFLPPCLPVFPACLYCLPCLHLKRRRSCQSDSVHLWSLLISEEKCLRSADAGLCHHVCWSPLFLCWGGRGGGS